MCGSCIRKMRCRLHTTRMVMTIREKFADLRFEVSKYKDNHMVLFIKDFCRSHPLWSTFLTIGQKSQTAFAWLVSKPIIINITEPHNCICRASSSVTFKTWVRFPSAPPRDYMGLIEVWLWQTCGPIAYGWIMLETIFKDYAPFISILHNIQTDNLLLGL